MTTTRQKSDLLNREAAIATANGKIIEDYARANRERTAGMQDRNQIVATVADCQRAKGTGAAISIEAKIAGRPTGMLTLRQSYLR